MPRIGVYVRLWTEGYFGQDQWKMVILRWLPVPDAHSFGMADRMRASFWIIFAQEARSKCTVVGKINWE